MGQQQYNTSRQIFFGLMTGRKENEFATKKDVTL